MDLEYESLVDRCDSQIPYASHPRISYALYYYSYKK
jgi:hypothetical protein